MRLLIRRVAYNSRIHPIRAFKMSSSSDNAPGAPAPTFALTPKGDVERPQVKTAACLIIGDEVLNGMLSGQQKEATG